jgi:hypothetical protein
MNLNHKAGESVETRLENHWKRMDAIVSVQERLEDEFYDRLARLEALVSHLIKANKVEFGDLCLLPESKPSECECKPPNIGKAIQVNNLVDKLCVKCGDVVKSIQSDEPKIEPNAYDNDGNPIQIKLSGGTDEPKCSCNATEGWKNCSLHRNQVLEPKDRTFHCVSCGHSGLYQIELKCCPKCGFNESKCKHNYVKGDPEITTADEYCILCGEDKDEPTISISRKVAEEFLRKSTHTTFHDIQDELRRAIGK